MGPKFAGAAALVAAYALGSASIACAQSSAPPSGNCQLHVYPAEGVHSVGDDFDAVHRVDQDLRHYYETAGRPLNWLSTDRQTALLREIPLGTLADTVATTTIHAEPLTRHQAIEPGARESGDGCLVEVMLPQIMLERGGLAERSLRVFGVVRRYDNRALVHGYSGFAAAPMKGFQLKSPADADSATALVEQAYRNAVGLLLQNAAKAMTK